MLNFLRRIYHFYVRTFVSDKAYIQQKFRKKMGYALNLKNPRTLNEKINWLKLHDRTPLHTQCSDKYGVREYVKSRIGADYLVPLYYQTKNVADIHEGNINRFPCIIKTNHDSSGGIFLRNDHQADWQEIRAKLEKRMRSNYYRGSREWQYKHIEPRIIVEQLLLDDAGKIPADIKVHVFHGKPEMIQMDQGRGTDGHFRNWYSPSWELLPMRWSSVLKNGRVTDPKNIPVAKPRSLEKILELSRNLAEPFLYARIDWYEVGDRIFFGEITFHHDGGYRPILPREWDLKLGEKLDLQHKK